MTQAGAEPPHHLGVTRDAHDPGLPKMYCSQYKREGMARLQTLL